MKLELIYWTWKLLHGLISLYSLAMLVYILLSWFPGAQDSKLGSLLGRFVQPYLGWFQRFIPPILGLDLSPVPAYALIYLFQRALDIIFMNLMY